LLPTFHFILGVKIDDLHSFINLNKSLIFLSGLFKFLYRDFNLFINTAQAISFAQPTTLPHTRLTIPLTAWSALIKSVKSSNHLVLPLSLTIALFITSFSVFSIALYLSFNTAYSGVHIALSITLFISALILLLTIASITALSTSL